MAVRLTIGQYFDADSPVHRLDPRAKVTGALCMMVAVFFIHTPLQLAFGFVVITGLLALSRVPVRQTLDSVRPMLFVLLVLGIFNLLVVNTGDTLLALGPLRITTDGVRAALLYSLRLVIGVLAGTCLLLTTTPAQLTDAFDSMLSPLARIGLPAHELAMVFSLMLRFIPTIADEASAVIDAQRSRGGSLGEGSPAKRVRSVASVLVALLASSVHHANDLSRALDARCYEGGTERSHWHPLHMRPADWLALALTCAYVVVLILLGH